MDGREQLFPNAWIPEVGVNRKKTYGEWQGIVEQFRTQSPGIIVPLTHGMTSKPGSSVWKCTYTDLLGCCVCQCQIQFANVSRLEFASRNRIYSHRVLSCIGHTLSRTTCPTFSPRLRVWSLLNGFPMWQQTESGPCSLRRSSWSRCCPPPLRPLV